MTISFWQNQARDQEQTVDVAIVGGGLLGCATAFWLRERAPSCRIAILEAQHLGAGASGRNAGFVLPVLSTDYEADLRRHGGHRARQLLQFVGESCQLIGDRLQGASFDFRKRGGILAAGTPEEARRLRESIPPLRADGLPVAFLSAEAVNNRLVGQGYHGALYIPSAGMLNPLMFTRHLADESGATILEHHCVQSIKQGEEGSCVLETPLRQVHARQCVVTVGADLSRLYPSLRRFARPMRAQMLATEPADESWLGVPVYSHDGHYYIRQLNDGTLLVGGARHRHRDDEAGFDDETTPALQADLERYLHSYFPQAQSLGVQQRWSGAMSFSPDRAPVVGRLPDVPGLWAAGCTGHGLSFSMGLGRLLAKTVLGSGEAEAFPLFSTERLAEKTA